MSGPRLLVIGCPYSLARGAGESAVPVCSPGADRTTSAPGCVSRGRCCGAGWLLWCGVGSDGGGHVRGDHDADGRAVERERRDVAVALREAGVGVRHAAVSGADGGVVREAARRRGAVRVGLGGDARALGTEVPAGDLVGRAVVDLGERDRAGDDACCGSGSGWCRPSSPRRWWSSR